MTLNILRYCWTSNLLDKNSNVGLSYFRVFVPGGVINLLRDQSRVKTSLCDLKQACFFTKALSKLKVNDFFTVNRQAARHTIQSHCLCVGGVGKEGGRREGGGCLGNSSVQIIITVTVSAHPTYNRNGS